MITATALLCFALTSYRETRGEEVAAQIAALKTLQNRSTINGTSVCKEVSKHRQFAWVRKYGIRHPNPQGQFDRAAWHQAKQLAASMDIVSVAGISKQHIYFNTLALGKRYHTKTTAKKIGGLIFY